MNESAEIIRQIELQIQQLLNIRAYFPTMTNEVIGLTEFATAPFYQQKGFPITFQFPVALTAERIEEVNQIGRWVNQSFIVRLCALLESYHVIPTNGNGRINLQLDGHDEVDIVRRLRNILAHTSGRYDSNNPDEKKLYQRITNKFSINVGSSEVPRDFPLPIDTLLIPLADGCKRYVQASV